MTGRFLPYGRQLIEADDIAAVTAALQGDYLTTGPMVERFEESLRQATGAPFAVSCANGTAALHMAMLALDLKPGDVAVVPAVTFLATANGARFCGADVVFADVDPQTGLMTPDTLREALGRSGGRARVVLPVHLNGQPCDMPAIRAIADEAGLAVVEDACHALATRHAEPEPALVGACRWSDMACFSFHPVKAIAMGEGGAVTTRDERLADRLRLFRSHGMERRPDRWVGRDAGFDPPGDPCPWYYEQQVLGYNYRLTDIQCALGVSQLAKLPRFMERRRALVAAYDRLLAPFSNLVRPVGRVPTAETGWHLYAVHVDFAAAGTTRTRLMRALAAEGVGTQVHYIPVPDQPFHKASAEGAQFPGAQAYYDRALSLPLQAGMDEADVAFVVRTLVRVLAGQ
ncbi:MAG TPA: UDP-4-amino-4,6-dideoxy-N-acetyl-beta-L-altrosamine transaminase [Azospirillaceae bacterium]|nr:UDP-4-amino-4,6-dideoxy-N-acetyl-beta-L-altrosamine transaminase [Azospirillaceae bacterium]